MADSYSQHRLLEVNSHSLFSKWFSESGKLVQQLFSSISTLAEDEDLFLVVLIDEVESLTAARAGAVEGREPSDALRVVNALLTQLDRLRQRKNVLVLATSNLAGAIGELSILRKSWELRLDRPSVSRQGGHSSVYRPSSDGGDIRYPPQLPFGTTGERSCPTTRWSLVLSVIGLTLCLRRYRIEGSQILRIEPQWPAIESGMPLVCCGRCQRSARHA